MSRVVGQRTFRSDTRLRGEAQQRVRHAIAGPIVGFVVGASSLWLAAWVSRAPGTSGLEAWRTGLGWTLPDGETPSSWIFGLVATGMALLLVTVINDVGSGLGSEVVSANAYLLDVVGFGITLGTSGGCWVIMMTHWQSKGVASLAAASALLLGVLNALYGTNPHSLRISVSRATERRYRLRRSWPEPLHGPAAPRWPEYRIVLAWGLTVVLFSLLMGLLAAAKVAGSGQGDDDLRRVVLLVQILMMVLTWWLVLEVATRDGVTQALARTVWGEWLLRVAAILVCAYACLMVWAFSSPLVAGAWWVPATVSMLGPLLWWYVCQSRGYLMPWHRRGVHLEDQRLGQQIRSKRTRLGGSTTSLPRTLTSNASSSLGSPSRLIRQRREE